MSNKNITKNEAFDVEKIRRFTQTEFNSLTNTTTEFPFCFQVGTDVLVGKYRVTKIHDKTWRVSVKDQQIFDFFTRKDAIFYCIALHQKQTKLAKDIQDNDGLLNRLEFDASLYRIRYKKAQSKGDEWGEEYYSTRYTEVQHKIKAVKKEIEKNLNLAKSSAITK